MGWDRLKVDVALTPALASTERRTLRKEDSVYIVVDVLRATSTIVALLERGCPRVYPVAGIEDARRLARDGGFLLAGERDGLPLPDFDLGNSPSQVGNMDFAGKSVVITTTNGTRAIERVRGAGAVLAGAFLNATAACARALELSEKGAGAVTIVCAGEKGGFVLDDAVCSGLLVKRLSQIAGERGIAASLSDSACAAKRLYESYLDLTEAFKDSSSGKRLLEIGRGDDLVFSSRVDVYRIVPVLATCDPCTSEPVWFQKYE